MDLIETKLKSTLYRVDCPTDMELGEFELGLLDASNRAAAIATHSKSCPHCLAELVQIRHYMELPLVGDQFLSPTQEITTPFLERVKIVVVDLLSPTNDSLLNPEMLPAMRGAQGDMETRVFQVESYIIALSAVKNAAVWPRQQIIGDISPLDEGNENFQNWSAYLWRDGKLLATTPVSRDSHFTFNDIQFANKPHELILSGPRVEIHLQNLHMA